MRRAILSVMLIAGFCSFAKTILSDEKAAVAKAPPQLQAAVARLEAATANFSPAGRGPFSLPDNHGSLIHHVDQQPSVEVGGQRGYRIVLRTSWRDAPADYAPQQQQTDGAEEKRLALAAKQGNWATKHADWHFVLVPLGDKKLPDDAKRDILWNVPDEKEFRLPVALGEGGGFAWFTFTSVLEQHFVRKKLQLTGGDDPLQLALLTLSHRDQALGFLFTECGEQGFTALDQVTHAGDDPQNVVRKCNAIRDMNEFRDERATARLIKLYFSSRNNEVKQAAATALIGKPLRPEASLAYIDMISHFGRSSEAIDICMELGLKDALPAIGTIVEKPSSLRNYLRAYNAYRQLSGKPIEAKLIEAADVLLKQVIHEPDKRPTPDELAIARRAIATSADVDGAAYLGFSLLVFQTKGSGSPAAKDGMEILKALPRPVIHDLCDRLLKNDNGVSGLERMTVLDVSRQILGTSGIER